MATAAVTGGTACTWKSDDNTCVNAITFSTACSEFDNYPHLCEGDSSNCGFYNFNANSCHLGTVAPAYASNCASLNGFVDECNAITATDGDNMVGCKYNSKTHICLAKYDCNV